MPGDADLHTAAQMERLRDEVHNVVSEDPVARAFRTGNAVEAHREAWRYLTYLPGIVDELLALRAALAAAPASEDDDLLDKAATHLAFLTREPEGWWDDEHCLDNGQSVVIIDRLVVALRARAGSPPPTPAPTREQIHDAIADALTEHVWARGTGEIDGEGIAEAADAVMALIAQPDRDAFHEYDDHELTELVAKHTPPGTAVRVDEDTPS